MIHWLMKVQPSKMVLTHVHALFQCRAAAKAKPVKIDCDLMFHHARGSKAVIVRQRDKNCKAKPAA